MVIFPMIDHESFDLEKLLLGLPLWALAGVAIGYLFEKKKKADKRKKPKAAV